MHSLLTEARHAKGHDRQRGSSLCYSVLAFPRPFRTSFATYTRIRPPTLSMRKLLRAGLASGFLFTKDCDPVCRWLMTDIYPPEPASAFFVPWCLADATIWVEDPSARCLVVMERDGNGSPNLASDITAQRRKSGWSLVLDGRHYVLRLELLI